MTDPEPDPLAAKKRSSSRQRRLVWGCLALLAAAGLTLARCVVWRDQLVIRNESGEPLVELELRCQDATYRRDRLDPGAEWIVFPRIRGEDGPLLTCRNVAATTNWEQDAYIESRGYQVAFRVLPGGKVDIDTSLMFKAPWK